MEPLIHEFGSSAPETKKYQKNSFFIYFENFTNIHYWDPQKAHLQLLCDIYIGTTIIYSWKFQSSAPETKKIINIVFFLFFTTLSIYIIQTLKRHICTYYVTYIQVKGYHIGRSFWVLLRKRKNSLKFIFSTFSETLSLCNVQTPKRHICTYNMIYLWVQWYVIVGSFRVSLRKRKINFPLFFPFVEKVTIISQ